MEEPRELPKRPDEEQVAQQEAAETWARDHGTIYDEEGRVADSGVAQRLANLEKPARDLEHAMKLEASGELTEPQKENVKNMDALLEMYPHAFDVEFYEEEEGKSQRVLVLRESINNAGGVYAILTQNGIFQVGVYARGERDPMLSWREIRRVNLAAVSDYMDKGGYTDRVAVKLPVEKLFLDLPGEDDDHYVLASKVNLVDGSAPGVVGWNINDFLARIRRVEVSRAEEKAKIEMKNDSSRSLRRLVELASK